MWPPKFWESGKFSTNWELVNVIPIYKKVIREDPGNDRPFSLASVPREVMDKIILCAVERPGKSLRFPMLSSP